MLLIFSLLLPAMTVLFWAALFAMDIRPFSSVGRLLFLSSALIGVYLLGDALLLTNFCRLEAIVLIDTLESVIVLTLCPLAFLVIREASGCHTAVSRALWAFLPALLIFGGNVLLYIVMGTDEAQRYWQSLGTHLYFPEGEFRQPLYVTHYYLDIILNDCLVFLQCVALLAYVTLRYFRLRRAAHYVSPAYLSWLVWMGVSTLIAAVLMALWRDVWLNHAYAMLVCYLVWTVSLFLMFYYAYRTVLSGLPAVRPDVPSEPGADISGEDNPADASASWQSVSWQQLCEALDRYMEQERPWLNASLRLEDVSQAIASNRTYVSRLVRERYGCSFNDYINRKRVEHAQTLLLERPQSRLEDVAYESGFLSASTFIRIFKQVVGKTPKSWVAEKYGGES